jgi:hypothetical protein
VSSLLHVTKLHQVDSKPEAGVNLHGPGKLGKQTLVGYFLNVLNLMTLAPSHGYTSIHVVNLSGSLGHGLQIILNTHI